MEPVLVVLASSAGAAAAAALGVLPLIGRRLPPAAWMGWSNALAAGLMTASAFALLEPRLVDSAPVLAVASAVGILFIHATRLFFGTGELALNRLDDPSEKYGYEVLLVASVHSTAEGVAIGAAMASSVPFGLVVALAMALHNIPEGALLAAVFRAGDAGLARAGTLAVISNLGLVLMAVTTFAVVREVPAALPWTLGFAAGALIYLVMTDLLPDSYREAGATSIAMAVILALWTFGLLHGAFLG